jgi:hypothetical protein
MALSVRRDQPAMPARVERKQDSVAELLAAFSAR